jgi:hypothetical protein
MRRTTARFRLRAALIDQKRALDFYPDAFSSREPEATSLENAIKRMNDL